MTRKKVASQPQKIVKVKNPAQKRGLLTKMTLAFFARPRLTALIWVSLLVFGVLSYTTFLKREGFPSINIPITIVNGVYFVNDPARVDVELADPFSKIALQQPGVSTVQTQSQGNFFSAVVNYESGINAQEAVASLQAAIETSDQIPDEAKLQYNAPYFGATGPNADKIDMAASFFSLSEGTAADQLNSAAAELVAELNAQKPELVDRFFLIDQFSAVTDPTTGQERRIQKSFDRFGERLENESEFFNSAIIAVSAVPGADAIELDKQVSAALMSAAEDLAESGYETRVVASFAPAIENNINELQKVLLEGLLAVLIVGSLVIAVRASVITVVSMVTVITITLGLLYVVGYSLNVITLFALILGLSLIVDDTIIMTEAIDVSKRKLRDSHKIISDATHKVSRAMVAATVTAAISFAPLLFVGGVLGDFIRVIPITIIVSLLVSLLVALIFIPLFARVLMLRSSKALSKKSGPRLEDRVAGFVTKPMLWARGSRRKLISVGLTAVMIGLGFVVASGFIAKNVIFNIFPPSKDTNGLTLQLVFPENTTLEEAQEIADEANVLFADVVGENFEQSSYYNSGTISQATLYADIVSYSKRDVTSTELVRQLDARFADFEGAKVQAGQQDIGPPASNFTVRIVTDDREAAFRLAQDISDFLESASLMRPNGTIAPIRSVAVSSQGEFVRNEGELNVQVTAVFQDTDTSTLVSLAQQAVSEEFDAAQLATYGLGPDVIRFDLGQEGSNQDSFQALLLAFPLLLLVMYGILVFQFRSFLQPALIFMAVPFSLFGVTLGLYLTNNAFSFFSMLGFFALVGLSIKNTILLTDYANQARRAGLGAIDATVAGLTERFRPLLATSLTAVVSLVPLALTSPFWQGLAVVLIFGLLSSTLLVVLIFPYYYLGGEYLRYAVRASDFVIWFFVTLLVIFGVSTFASAFIAIVAGVLAAVTVPVALQVLRRSASKSKKSK